MSVQLPEEVSSAWELREGPLVFSTADSSGMPNSIYASMVHRMHDGCIAIVDNYFNKTEGNICCNTKGSVLFITNARKSYQVKGTIAYYTAGPLYDEMLTWADPKHPRKGVAIVTPEAVYRGGDKLA